MYHLRRLLIYISLSVILMSATPVAHLLPTIDTNAKIKAVFVYNFSKYFEWPSSYKDGNFLILVMGNSTLTNEISSMASSKAVGSQKFEVKSISSVDQITKCHMLYVPADSPVELSKIISKIKNYSTLLITEKDGMTKQGSAINFVVQNNKQKFELNKTNAIKYDIKVSSSLEPLAIQVN
jgi:hypothetical protein